MTTYEVQVVRRVTGLEDWFFAMVYKAEINKDGHWPANHTTFGWTAAGAERKARRWIAKDSMPAPSPSVVKNFEVEA